MKPAPRDFRLTRDGHAIHLRDFGKDTITVSVERPLFSQGWPYLKDADARRLIRFLETRLRER